jgi:hypothetical protein
MPIVCPIDGQADVVQDLTTLASDHTSDLSTQLALPPAPSPPSSRACLKWVLTLYLLGIGICAVPFAAPKSGLLPAAGLGMLFFLLGYLVIVVFDRIDRKARDDFAADSRVWEALMERWSGLYYCHRHAVVFDPATGESVPPERIAQLLTR